MSTRIASYKELNALPEKTVVIDAHQSVYQHAGFGYWTSADEAYHEGAGASFPAAGHIPLPVYVLHLGGDHD